MSEFFKLSIDRISAVFGPSRSADALTAIRHLDERYGRDPIFALKESRFYHLQMKVPIDVLNPTRTTPAISFSCGAKFPNQADFRIDFNPNSLGPDAISMMMGFMESAGIRNPYSMLLNGNMTRLDFAIDLPGLSVDDVVIRGVGQRKHGIYSGFGQPETFIIGSKRSNRIVCYNKYNGIRLECRPTTKRPYTDLPFIPNPFARVSIIPASIIKSLIEPPWGDHVVNTIRVIGFTKGTQGLANKAAVLAALKNPENSVLPPPDEIWKQWPLAIERSGLIAAGTTISAEEVPDSAMTQQIHHSE